MVEKGAPVEKRKLLLVSTPSTSTGVFMAGNYIAFDCFQVHVLL
jgi:hypothetical protein